MGVGCGLPAWINEAETREGGSPASQAALQARSEGFNLERKAEIGEMWLLVREGGEVDISVEAENLESLQRKNWGAKCHQTRSLIQSGLWTIAVAPSRVSCMHTILRQCSKIFYARSHTVGDNKLCGIYLIFRLDLNYIMGSQWKWTVFELLLHNAFPYTTTECC